jgi:hypothetical protein
VAGKTLAVIGALGLALVAAAGCTATPPPDAPRITAQAPAAAPAPAEVEQLAPARITVPDLELDRPLVSLGLDAAGAHEVPVGALDVGWYRGGPAPGEVGPAIVLGHVNWKGVQGSFASTGTPSSSTTCSRHRKTASRSTGSTGAPTARSCVSSPAAVTSTPPGTTTSTT